MSIALYTLVGFRTDGVSLAVDVVPGVSRDHALALARAFLAEHGSCDLVEVYSGGEQIDAVRRATGATAA